MKTIDPDFEYFNTEVSLTLNKYLEKQKFTISENKHLYHPLYLQGFDFLFGEGFSKEKLENRLKMVGWKPVMVNGYLTSYDYFTYLHRHEIPININIRPGDQIDYALFPDMIHDIFGHCPMLVSKLYSDFLDEISQFIFTIELEGRDKEYLNLHRPSYDGRMEVLDLITLKENELKANPTPYYYHTSIALWTVEFGLLEIQDEVQAYGAALVASPLEITRIKEGKSKILKLTDSAVENDFNFSDFQTCLYSTSTFEEIKDKITHLAL